MSAVLVSKRPPWTAESSRPFPHFIYISSYLVWWLRMFLVHF